MVAPTPSSLARALPRCRSPPGGVEDVCRDAPQVLLEEYVQGSRRDCPTLHSLLEEPSDREEKDQLPEVVPRKRAPRFCRHGHLGPATKYGTREPLPLGHF